jgi:hypothetical protein
MKQPTDLFGQPIGPAQQSFFGEGEDRLQAPKQKIGPDPERARRKLLAVLATARAAKRMPWPEGEARMWQTVFPQMANWLPPDEAEQLRLAFAQELERLRSAA